MNRGRLGGVLRSRVTSTTVLTAALATVVVVAATVTGLPVTHVSANDGGVWLVNDSAPGNFGELNVPIRQLSLTVPAKTEPQNDNLDVRQSGTTVIAIDYVARRVYPIDLETGAADTSGGVSFTGAGKVALGGGVAALLELGTVTDPGRVWATKVGAAQTATLSELDGSDQKPVATLADAESVAVDSAGDVYVASPTALLTLPATPAGFGPARVIKFQRPLTQGNVALTTVGMVPVVMNTSPSDPVLLFPLSGRVTRLPPRAATGAAPVFFLQQSGPTAGDVLVASPNELIGVPIGGGSYRDLAILPGDGGTPAQPVELDGCAHGAWAGSPGTVVQSCTGTAPVTSTLTSEGTGGPASLVTPVFRENNNELILNDTSNGDAWTVVGRPAPIVDSQDWRQVVQAETAHARKNAHNSSSPQADQHRDRPVLHNPTLYARAGVESTLHVLADDYDPGGSILSIVSVTPGAGFTAHIAPDTQTVVLWLQPGWHAPVTFQYTVIDGFRLSRTGSVQVDPTNAETPPTAPRTPPPTRHVVSGGTVSMEVLGGWNQAQNEPLSLTDASVSAGEVTWTSGGLISYTAPSEARNTTVTMIYHVTDGRSAPVGSQLHLVVLGRGDLTAYPPEAEPVAIRVIVDKPTTLDPLANDVFGADPRNPQATLAMAGPVAEAAGITVVTNTNTGILTLTASQSDVYSLRYQATFGSAESVAAQILVYAVGPSGSAQSPVTTPVTMVLRGQYAATVDVLDADYDPNGGLLSVVGVDAPPDLQATVVDGEYLRVGATTQQPSRTQVVTYEVSNGETDPVPGQVTVDWEPPMNPTAPVVPSTYATVRAGDEVDVPVLASANDPDGESVHLLDGGTPASVSIAQTNPQAPYPTGLGSASLSGGYLRYAAPPQDTALKAITSPEEVTVSYEVESQFWRRTSGQTYITIEPDNPSLDSSPAPVEVDARVTSGDTIAIPIPTTGITLDGDSVTVTGVTSAPTLGRIMGFTGNSITYQAYPVSPGSGTFTGGTDTFSYQVEGPSGLTAQGIVRVGVTPPVQAEPPVAMDQYVTAKPGQTIDVDLLSGDIVSPGDVVTVKLPKQPRAALPPGTRLLGGETLQVVAPTGPVARSIAFGLTDGTATVSSAHVSISDEPGFVVPPVATDYYPSAPRAGSGSVRVNVLAKDSDPSGGTSGLLVVGSPASGVRVSGPDLVIPSSKYPRSVPYEIKSATTGATAVGVVHVPGRAVGPQLIAGREIHVPEGGTKKVNIGNYIADSTHPIRLTQYNQVSASPSGGLSVEPVDNSNTILILRGAAGYVGPGSLTVQVIDAPTLSAAGAHIATFAIPVQVGKPTPVIRCPTTPLQVVESGPPVDADIAGICTVWTPDGTNPNTLKYTERWAKAVPGLSLGWKPGQVGQVVAVSATSSAKGGAVGQIIVGVQSAGPTATSILKVQAVEARRPSIKPITLQVLGRPGAPTGVQAVPGNSRVQLSWQDASDGGTPIEYYDVTAKGVSTQQTTGTALTWSGLNNGQNYTFTIVAYNREGAGPASKPFIAKPNSVPGVPTNVRAHGANMQATVTWTAPSNGGKTLDHYFVSIRGASGQASASVPGNQTFYVWHDLSNSVGPYTFTVVAHNSDGFGPVSAVSNPAYANGRPNQPPPPKATPESTSQTTTTVTVTWPEIRSCNDAQPCASYTVTEYSDTRLVTSVTVPGGQCDPSGGCSQSFPNITDSGASYTYTLTATNSEHDEPSPASVPSAPVYTAGSPNPIQEATVTPSNQAAGGGQLTVTFVLPASNSSGISKVDYDASGPGGRTSFWPSPGTSGQTVHETIPGLQNGTAYSVTVWACGEKANGATSGCATPSSAGCPPSVTQCNTPYGPPNPPSVTDSGDGVTVTYSWTGGGNNGRAVSMYYYCIDSNPCTSATSPGSVPVNYGGCSTQTYSVSGYVIDTAGQRSASSQPDLTFLPCPSISNIQFVQTSGCELNPAPGGPAFYGYAGYYVVTLDTNDVPSNYVSNETADVVYERYNNPSDEGHIYSTYPYSPGQSTYGPPYGEQQGGAWGGFWHEDYTNIFTFAFDVAGGGLVSKSLTTVFPACG